MAVVAAPPEAEETEGLLTAEGEGRSA